MKNFTGLDVTTSQYNQCSTYKCHEAQVRSQTYVCPLKGRESCAVTLYRVSADREDLIDSPMWFHKKGLSETRSGYGRRLNSGYKIMFNGRQYRCYVTIFSNSGTMWFKCKGTRIIVS